ncbi:MAG: hypothetical protein JRG86_19680 [Deltaproteobacteria bacterium]|nr:hypothetical protein [Deltaproteobacteria bacterium]
MACEGGVVADTSAEDPELTLSGLTRRERLERIASAERDRRGGREALAIAAIGEPNEWPARVVLALVRLSSDDAPGARRLLEEGLDVWAREAGLPPLAATEVEPEESRTRSSAPEPAAAESWAPLEIPEPPPLDERLERPFDSFELDRAFEQAEAQTDEMHDVNRVAARVLMDEPVGLAELSGHPIESLQPEPEPERWPDPESAAELEAVAVEVDLEPLAAPAQSQRPSSDALRAQMDAAFVERDLAEQGATTLTSGGGKGRARAEILATLERWLQNLERRRPGGAR